MNVLRRLRSSRTPPDRDEPAAVLDVGAVADVLSGGRGHVTVGPDDTPVLIVRTRRGLFAVRNRCPHRSRRLDGGAVRGRYIRCPFHGREYDLGSGTCRHGDGERPLATYRCWTERGHLFLALPPQDPWDDDPG